jgi:hypothetical protein
MLPDRPGPVRIPAPEPALPARPAPPRVRRRWPKRPVLLAAFLVLLIAGCALAIGRGGGTPPARDAAPVASTAPSTDARAATSEAFAFDIGDTTGCQTRSGVTPQLLCPLPDGTVEYLQVEDPEAAYRRIAGPDDATPSRGEAACARGHADERAWARPQAPAEVAGRYLCRLFEGRAEIWWTVDDSGLLGHAFRRDSDLAGLFTWWRARGEGHAEHP